MRLLLAITLILLFQWLYNSQMSTVTLHRNACEAVSMSEAAVSLLLSPLSLYSWMASTLLRFLLSIPALVFSSLYHSLLLLLAGPWCVATVCISLLLTFLHITLYLFHLALVVAVVAILTFMHYKMVDSDTPSDKVLSKHKKLEEHQTKTRLMMVGHRVSHQG